MIAKVRFESDPPIGCNAAYRALAGCINAKRQLCIRRQRTISPELEIELVVEKGVRAETSDLLRVHLLDEGAGAGHRRQRGTYVWKAPGGNRVPDILDGRVVVGGYAP